MWTISTILPPAFKTLSSPELYTFHHTNQQLATKLVRPGVIRVAELRDATAVDVF